MTLLPKILANRRILVLEHQLERERGLRLEAERNANRFHALLISERIRNLPTRVRS
jgi:hypothetical protein